MTAVEERRGVCVMNGSAKSRTSRDDGPRKKIEARVRCQNRIRYGKFSQFQDVCIGSKMP